MRKQLYEIIILAACVISQAALAATCEQGSETHIWISPRIIKPGTAISVMAVSSSQTPTDLILTHPNGEIEHLITTSNAGLPSRLSTQINGLDEGNYQLEVKNNDQSLGCRILFNGDNKEEKKAQWNNDYEAFYSAWIEQLFDSPIAVNLHFPSLEPVLRDSDRNFLHNYLGLKEDEKLPATTDCTDLPYFLRSYFAWKNGLLFSYRLCDRGFTEARPSCSDAQVISDFAQNIPAPVAKFQALSRTLINIVQSGNSRTSAINENSDFYHLALRREVLWPGTIYADPYGHVLMLTKWVAQTPSSPGILFAVAAQPDNSISRKRFGEGSFLFANSASAAPGFKAFRPIANNQLLLTNAQLPNFSNQQEKLVPEDFYNHVDKLINPKGLDAKQTYEALLIAFVEQLEARVRSVENGEQHFRTSGGIIEMPDIPLHEEAIFETTGLWEDYATPAGDIRLLNAIDILLRFPDKIARHPELFNLNYQAAQDAKKQILELHGQLTRQKKITYQRSNGMPLQLTIAEVLARRTALEMAYNPNDCPEIRWGAQPGSAEYGSCIRHAPLKQIQQMAKKRDWFHAAQRPPR